MTTLSDIEFLIHCHVSPAPHPRRHATAVREAIQRFLWEDMIEPNGDGYTTTVRGHEWLETLKKTPFPPATET